MREDIIDHTLGMLISNLLWEEGVRLKDLDTYSAEQLRDILEHHDQSRMFRDSGVRMVGWQTTLDFARELLDKVESFKTPTHVVYESVFVIGFLALEEFVNSFYRDIYIGKRMSGLVKITDSEITAIIDDLTLREKFDKGLKVLIGRSLKQDLPVIWHVFDQARRVRVSVVHNKSEVKLFKNNEPLIPRPDRLNVLAEEFLKVIPEITEYLSDSYPDEIIAIDEELHEMWRIVKTRLDIDTTDLIKHLERNKRDMNPDEAISDDE